MQVNKGWGFLMVPVLAILAMGCQKELDEESFGICVLQKISIYEGAATAPTETYFFEYTQVGSWPASVSIDIPSVPYSQVIPISVQDRKVDLGDFGSFEVDGSRRITELIVNKEYPGAVEGDYFYGYNAQGFLEDRIYDDGVRDFELTKFANNGLSLSTFDTQLNPPSSPIALGELTYQTAIQNGNNDVLVFTDIMPELLPFAPLIGIGKLGNLPLEKYVLTLPTLGGVTLQYAYANYTFDKGLLTGFDNVISLPGLPPINRKFRMEYLCR
jgi:hypothetical protein